MSEESVKVTLTEEDRNKILRLLARLTSRMKPGPNRDEIQKLYNKVNNHNPFRKHDKDLLMLILNGLMLTPPTQFGIPWTKKLLLWPWIQLFITNRKLMKAYKEEKERIDELRKKVYQLNTSNLITL